MIGGDKNKRAIILFVFIHSFEHPGASLNAAATLTRSALTSNLINLEIVMSEQLQETLSMFI